jgi:hypothetical protein
MIMQQFARFREGDLGRIFPMANAASARLMRLKAHRLCDAGIITAALKAEVDRRADQLLVGAVVAPVDRGARHYSAGTRHQVSGR